MYQTINQFKKEYQHKFKIIRNKKENWEMNTKKREQKYGKNNFINY